MISHFRQEFRFVCEAAWWSHILHPENASESGSPRCLDAVACEFLLSVPARDKIVCGPLTVMGELVSCRFSQCCYPRKSLFSGFTTNRPNLSSTPLKVDNHSCIHFYFKKIWETIESSIARKIWYRLPEWTERMHMHSFSINFVCWIHVCGAKNCMEIHDFFISWNCLHNILYP